MKGTLLIWHPSQDLPGPELPRIKTIVTSLAFKAFIFSGKTD